VIRGTISDSGGVLANNTAAGRLYTLDGVELNVSRNKEDDDSYRIGGIIPGSYRVVLGAYDSNLIDELYNDNKCPRHSCDPAPGQVFVITTGTEDISGIDAVLDTGGVVSGNLTDRISGLPIADYCVRVYTEAGVYAAFACSDVNGDFQSNTGLPDGNYRLSNALYYYQQHLGAAGGYLPQVWTNDDSFLYCGEECDFTLGDTFAITGGAPAENIDLAMVKSGTLHGTMTAEGIGNVGNTGLVSAFVDTDQITFGEQIAFVVTDSNGVWTMELPPGDYLVYFGSRRNAIGAPYVQSAWDGTPDGLPCPLLGCDTSDLVPVTIGTLPVELNMELKLGVELTGSVKDADTMDPVTYEGIEVWHSDGSKYLQIPPPSVRPDFRLTLPTGSYYAASNAAVIGDGYIDELWNDVHCDLNTCDPTTNVEAPTLITPGVGNTAVLDFLLDQGRKISGTVTADDGGAPLEDIKICVGHKVYTDTEECDVTDASGNYEVGGFVYLNDFVVYTKDVGGQAFYREMYNEQSCCDPADGDAVDLTGGDAVIDFALEASGRIAGLVTDVTTDEGIGDVEMWLMDDACVRVDVIETFTNGEEPGFIGRYAFSGVPDGIYYVYARATFQNYVGELYPDEKRINPCYGDYPAGQPIVIENKTQVEGIDFALDPGGSITGFISDSSGVLPFNAAHARLYDSEQQIIGLFGNWNDDNSYTIGGLPPATYNVVLTSNWRGLIGKRYDDVPCPRNSCDPILGDPITIESQEQVTGIDAVLEPGAVVSGTITDQGTGVGVPGFCYGIYTANGRYSFVNCGVPCDFTLGDVFTVTGQTVSHSINMAMVQGTRISGNVQFDGSPLEGIDVVLLGTSGGVFESAVTDASGNYEFVGVSPGSYPIRTLNKLGYEDRLHGIPTDIVCNPHCNPYSGTLVVVESGSDITGVDFELTLSGSISGVVTNGSAEPLSGITVEAYNSLGLRTATAITNPQGEYTIAGLGSGFFYVRTQNSLGYRNELFDDMPCSASCDVQLGTKVNVVDGVDTPNIDFELGFGSSLHGTLSYVGDETVPAASARIRIWDETGSEVAYFTVDANGQYRVEGLTPQNYYVRSVSFGDYYDVSADGTPCESSCDPLETAPVAVGVAEEVELNLDLPRGHTITALVRGPDGQPVSGVDVRAFDGTWEIKRARSGEVVTEDGKTFNLSISGLPPGDYTLEASSVALGFRTQMYNGVVCNGPCDPLAGTKITATGIPGIIPPVTINMTGGYSISGRITHFDAGRGYYRDWNSGVQLYQGTTLMRSMNTQRGNYTFSGLPPGEYRIGVRTGGTGDPIGEMYGGDQCTPEPCDIASGTPLIITNSDITGIDLALEEGGSITGYARDANGNSLVGMARLYSPSGQFHRETRISDYDTSRQQEGYFYFGGLASGTYYVLIDASSAYYLEEVCSYSWTYGLRCHDSPRYTTAVDTLYNGIACPGGACNVTLGTGIPVTAPASPSPSRGAGDTTITVTVPIGHNIRGSLKDHLDQPLAFTKVFFFDASGNPVAEALTDGSGNFVSSSGLPDGTYYAATSRPALPEDSPEEAIDAENGVGNGLQDQIWNGDSCDGVCAPPGSGTPIVITGADETGVNIVLSLAPGIDLEKLTNGIDADAPNGGDAPMIGAGETVTWTYRLTNIGGEALEQINVTDDQGVTVICPKTTLAPAEVMDCEASETAADLSQDPFTGVIGNCAGRPNSRLYQNNATATAETAGAVMVDDQDSSHYCNPSDELFSDGFE
jgi:protocatechuate 3,4-dioxygenase beta subunit